MHGTNRAPTLISVALLGPTEETGPFVSRPHQLAPRTTCARRTHPVEGRLHCDDAASQRAVTCELVRKDGDHGCEGVEVRLSGRARMELSAGTHWSGAPRSSRVAAVVRRHGLGSDISRVVSNSHCSKRRANELREATDGGSQSGSRARSASRRRCRATRARARPSSGS